MVTSKITKIIERKNDKVIKFDYLGKERSLILSHSARDYLFMKFGMEIKESVQIEVIRTIKPSFNSKGLVELFKIVKIYK